MKTSILKNTLLILFLSSFAIHLQAQEVYKANNDKSNVVIEGTSNIHDWEMDVEDLISEIHFLESSENEIESVTFQAPVKGLKSGKGKMDKNTYEALKADEYSTIKFESTSIKKSNGKYYAKGNLSIAGTTKNVEIPLELSKKDGKISLVTDYKINMLDYNVEPPTAMFGTIKTGESVVVKFNLIY